MSTFTPGIPATGETLGNSRLEVLNNFASLRETISQGSGNVGVGDQPNHIDVNDSGAGKHIFVQMPVQTAGVANLPAVNEGGLITELKSTGSELFYARDNNATRYQMTGPFAINTGSNPTSGTTPLYGGIILKWGKISNGSAAAVVFPDNFPTNLLSLQLTANSAVGTLTTFTAASTSGFTLLAAPTGTQVVYYIALGN